MKVDFHKDEISVNALLDCFSIPSNMEYLLTEIGIAINFYQNLAVDKTLSNLYQLDIFDGNKLHTLFSMFSNSTQKQFIKNHIPSAKLIIKDATDIRKNWELICSFVCPQFDNKPIELAIKFHITKNNFDFVSASATSKLLKEDELRSLSLMLPLLTPA